MWKPPRISCLFAVVQAITCNLAWQVVKDVFECMLGCSRVLLFGVCEHACMCYVSFYVSCVFLYMFFRTAIFNYLGFHRSVLTFQLLVHDHIILSLHFCSFVCVAK